MQDMLTWALLILAEVFLLSNGIWGFFLWRARKVQRHLRAELEGLHSASHQSIEAAPSLPAPPPAPLTDADLAETAEAPPNLEDLSQVVAILDDGSIDEAMGRLDEMNQTLHQQIETLQLEHTLAQQDQQKLAAVRLTIQKMREAFEALQYKHSRMQQDLQNKKLLIKRTMEDSELLYQQRVTLRREVRELRAVNARLSGDAERKDRLLQQHKAETQEQQQLRSEVWSLKSKLAARDADAERLQTEKEALAEEYAVLSKEYERIYANFMK